MLPARNFPRIAQRHRFAKLQLPCHFGRQLICLLLENLVIGGHGSAVSRRVPHRPTAHLQQSIAQADKRFSDPVQDPEIFRFRTHLLQKRAKPSDSTGDLPACQAA